MPVSAAAQGDEMTQLGVNLETETLGILERLGHPIAPRVLLDAVQQETGCTEQDALSTLYRLMDDQKVRLTVDQRLQAA